MLGSIVTPALVAAGLSLALAAPAAALSAQARTHVGAKPGGLVNLRGN